MYVLPYVCRCVLSGVVRSVFISLWVFRCVFHMFGLSLCSELVMSFVISLVVLPFMFISGLFISFVIYVVRSLCRSLVRSFVLSSR